MGTNNPSEEQLALVEARIIQLADTCVDPGLPIESDSYFDEHGFDLESASGQVMHAHNPKTRRLSLHAC